MVKEVLLLGNPKLYDISRAVKEDEIDDLDEVVGVMKRLIYMFIDKPVVFINPELLNKSPEKMTVWDDCLCFPDLLVKVERHRSCTISYLDENWTEQEMFLKGDLSELLQHEYDHLDGILAVSRAMDKQSFALRSQKEFLSGKF